MGQRACGKLNALEGVLRSFDRRDKVLLFSFSVQMLDVLAAFATFKGASGYGYGFVSMSMESRAWSPHM